MGFVFERTVNYYETDRMGVVHHSNYIRYMEEARCAWLEDIGMSFSTLEENDITIPVLGVNCSYKNHVTFNDTIIIQLFIKEYSGVRMTVGYEAKEKETGKIVFIAETKHCFTDKNLKPINMKKHFLEFNYKFQEMLEKDKIIDN